MKTKVLKADYTLRFADSIIRNFQSTMDAEDPLIIPPSLFGVNLLFQWIFHFVKRAKINKNISLKNYTISKVENIVFQQIGLQRKLKSLFQLKNKDICPACKIYHGLCSF